MSECFNQEKTDPGRLCVWMLIIIIIIIIINFRDKLISRRVNEGYAPEQNIQWIGYLVSLLQMSARVSTDKRPTEQRRRDDTQFVKPIKHRHDVCVLTELQRTRWSVYIVHRREFDLISKVAAAATFLICRCISDQVKQWRTWSRASRHDFTFVWGAQRRKKRLEVKTPET